MKPIRFLKENSKFALPYLWAITILDILFALLGIYFAIGMRSLIDEALTGYSQKVILKGVILALVVLSQIILQFVGVSLSVRMRGKVKKHYQSMIFQNLLQQNSLEEHSGTYIARITSDVSYVVDGVCNLIPRIALSITKFCGAFIALGFLDYKLLIFILILGALLVLCHFIYKKFLTKYHQDYQTKEAKSQAFMQEIIENQMIVHSFGKDSFIIGEEEKRLKDLYKAEIKRANLSVFANLGMSLGMVGAYALIVIYGAFKLSNGSPIYDASFTYGSLTAIMSLFTQLQTPLSSVADINQRYIMTKESTKRIMEILKEIPKEAEPLSDFEVISLNDFSFSYPDKVIFDKASFTLKKGESVTIKGPSGIGKSTLIKILLGKLETKEVMYVDNKPAKISSLVSYVPQGNWLLSGSVRDNLTLFDSKISDALIKKVLEIVSLESFSDLLDMNILERAKDISEGQAQRLAIARGLLLNKPILLLDEVTSALDKETEEKLLKNLSSLNKTIIYISHKDATNLYSNRVYEIRDKRIMEVK